MSSFAKLMAISAASTKASEEQAKAALAERQRSIEAKREVQAAKERQEREQEQKRRLKHFQDLEKEKERVEHEKERQEAMERLAEQRQEAYRHHLLYGPKKFSKSNRGESASHSDSPRSRSRAESPADDFISSYGGLTREEKRERKEQAELRRALAETSSPHRRTGHSSTGTGGRLKGGAVNIVEDPSSSAARMTANLAGKSTRERLAAMPMTLTKLNTKKRDLRTIDEIVTEMRQKKNSVLEGDQARSFNGWFDKSTKKDSSQQSAVPWSGTSTPEPPPSERLAKKIISRSLSPAPQLSSQPNGSAGVHKSLSAPSKVLCEVPSVKVSFKKMSQTSTMTKSSAVPSKRRRDESLSPPPRAKRPNKTRGYDSDVERSGGLNDDVRGEIWRLLGKDRNKYVAMDQFSDEDSDMEADAASLRREEMRSAKIARREDREAEEEERRHVDAKARRKRMLESSR